tara:strand:+ start:10494 stop:11204 length:711 start_codon:yes stop_codon:yes gene_type:complete
MQSNEIIVYDNVDECPYLPKTMARMPLRRPTKKLTGPQFDQRMFEGDRRYGRFLYRTACGDCQACEPIRISIRDFKPNKTQRRTLTRGNAQFLTVVQTPVVDSEHVALYNDHSDRKGLNSHSKTTSAYDYKMFLADTCCDTFEFSYYHEGKLIGVSIADRGSTCLSAVYCFYDLDFAKLSPGTFSVLKQIEKCADWNLEFLYLGYYVAENAHMNYKASFYPHQRLIDGEWREFKKN